MRLGAVAGAATDQRHLSADVIHGTRGVLPYGLSGMPVLGTSVSFECAGLHIVP
jgi:hypothetical protein